MDVANPWMHQSWSEYKKEREEGRRRRLSWMQRVMRWDKRDANEEPRRETEDDEESHDVSEEEFREKKSERSGRTERDLQHRARMEMGQMEESLGEMEGDDDGEGDGEGIADDTVERDRRIMKKHKARQYLGQSMRAEREMMFGKGEKADSETAVQAFDDMESVYQEAGGSHGRYSESETSFGRASQNSDSFSFSADSEFKRLQAEEESERLDAATNDLEEFRLDLAMGGAEEVSLLSEVHAEKNECPDSEDLTENVQREQNGGQPFRQRSEFHSPGQSLASGPSEISESCYEDSYDQDVEESSRKVEEPAAKPEDESELDISGEYSASGISEDGKRGFEDAYSLVPEENRRRFDRFAKDGAAQTSTQGEVEEPAAKPTEDSECDYSGENSASGISENGELYYEESYYQDMEDDKYLEDHRFENVMEDGSVNEELDYEEFCNQTTEEVKDAEFNGFEDGEVKTSMQGKDEEVAKPTDEHLTEEETTTTDEDDDVLGDEETDCYDLNEIKTYRQENHTSEIFQTLNEFKDAQILTDLELKTSDGKTIHVHAIVFSAVSSLARRYLSKQHTWFWDRKMEVLVVGPEVEYKALEAVVEFAYTGAIQCLNDLNVGEIRTAARYLAASRVMEICDKAVSKSKEKTKDKCVPASTELRINLQKIEELWKNDMGCDVTLDVISASFEVHKVILAACSDYFRAMFTLGMKESSQSSVYLKFLSAPELEALLDCSYTGSVALSWNSIFEITSTALQLQYQPALDLCLNFLQREINPHSCLDVASFAEAFGIIRLHDHAEDYVLRQFQKVSRTPKFKDLPAKNLLKYLNSFALCVPSELVVFRAVVDWIQAKPKRRLKLAKELMKTIHFPLMTFQEFKEVQTLSMWSNHSLKELYEAIFEDFCSNDTGTENKCRIYLPKESLVLSGGDQICEDLGTRSISKDLWFGNSLRNHMGIKKAMEWRRLGEMPQLPRFSHEVAVIRGQLYVLGGKKYYGTGDTLNSFFRYDPLENAWEELCPMLQARSTFSLVVFESKLYAIGGQSHPDYLETVEQYCPAANSWSFTRPLDLPLGGHVARVSAGRIFISGGLNNDYDCVCSMFTYHPEQGSTYLECMTRPRSLHCMEVLGDLLYVAGGLSQTDGDRIVDMLACEVYDPEADSWTRFPPLPMPHVGAGSAVLEGKFYILGGYSQENYNDMKTVHRYDPALRQWENMGMMPGPNNDLRACVLVLPEHLRQCSDQS